MEKYGFIYVWFDKKKKRYYIGSHWGKEDDGYVCSSQWMHRSKAKRPNDFKRRIVKRIYTNRIDLLQEEQRWLNMIKDHELAMLNTTTGKRETVRYYNLSKSVKNPWHMHEDKRKTVGQKISESKTGRSVPCTPEKAAAISAAKKGKKLSEEHKAALKGIKKKPHTDEWKAENSKRMKEQWDINSSRRQAVSEATKKRWEEYRKKKLETAV